MNRLPLRMLLAFLTTTGAAAATLPACSACKKDPPPHVDSPPPPPPPPVDAGLTPLIPLDDAGDAAPEPSGPAKPHAAAPPTNANATRVRQCCAAIRHEATRLGTSPEATMMMTVAMQCDMVAAQVAGGSAPEFGQVRQMLKGRVLPAACSGM
jgi:hypothetical protein